MASPWENPWNVGDKGSPIQQLAASVGRGVESSMQLAPAAAIADFVAQNPNHPLAQGINGYIEVQQRLSSPFNASEFQRSAPSKLRREDLPLGSAVGVAPGASASLSATVQKPFVGRKLMLGGATSSFVVESIIAQGQTMTAAAGDVPADAYAILDSFDNVAFPAMGSGATVVVRVRNVGLAAADIFGAIRGETGEA